VKARELYDAGKLNEAIESLSVELRSDPTDAQRRTFLFELLGFAGELDRAEKHLDVVAQSSPEAGMGALLYRTALHAERERQQMFLSGATPGGSSPRSPSGVLNGVAFQEISDADPRIGPRLEVFAAGQYLWIPLEHIATLQMSPPQRLRDLLWSPASLRTGPGFKGTDLGEVLLPVLAPLSWQHADDAVRLGRVTDWQEIEGGGYAPVGQKMFLVDGEVFPILEVRELEIEPPPPTQAD
jgi:type VI secretion system protein ImpE